MEHIEFIKSLLESGKVVKTEVNCYQLLDELNDENVDCVYIHSYSEKFEDVDQYYGFSDGSIIVRVFTDKLFLFDNDQSHDRWLVKQFASSVIKSHNLHSLCDGLNQLLDLVNDYNGNHETNLLFEDQINIYDLPVFFIGNDDCLDDDCISCDNENMIYFDEDCTNQGLHKIIPRTDK